MSIEQMVSLQVAVELIPMPSMSALYQFLHAHKDEFPGAYRRAGGPSVHRAGYEQRLLTESEILKIREMTIHPITQSRFRKSGRPRSIPKGIIGSIMKRCASA